MHDNSLERYLKVQVQMVAQWRAFAEQSDYLAIWHIVIKQRDCSREKCLS